MGQGVYYPAAFRCARLELFPVVRLFVGEKNKRLGEMQRILTARWSQGRCSAKCINRFFALRPFDWRVFPPKLVHADRLSDPLAENDVYEQEQSGLW